MKYSGENSLACSECNYSECKYSRKTHLKSRMLTNSEQKTFECSECTFCCSFMSNLKRHLLTHSNKDKEQQRVKVQCPCRKKTLNNQMLVYSGYLFYVEQSLKTSADALQTIGNSVFQVSVITRMLAQSGEKLFAYFECNYMCSLKQYSATFSHPQNTKFLPNIMQHTKSNNMKKKLVPHYLHYFFI